MASSAGCWSRTCRCTRSRARRRVRRATDGSRHDAARAGAAVPGDQARDDGHVHLPGLRGDVLREPLRRLLLHGRLARDLAADSAGRQARVLRQLVADSGHQHGHPAFLRRHLSLRPGGPLARQPAPFLHAVDHDHRPGIRIRGRSAVRVHPGLRPGPEPDGQHLRERVLRHDRLPRRARAGRADPADPDPRPRATRPVLRAESCRPGGGYPLLALRRRRLDLPLRNPLPGDHGNQMRWLAIVAVSVASVALLGACGGGTSQPAGSTKVTMTEFKFDPADLTVQHGKVVFWLVNAGSVSHDMSVQDSSGNAIATSELVSAGDSTEFDIDNLPAGSYKIICTQPGHADSGMKGTLTAT